jgi:hypothetical protein
MERVARPAARVTLAPIAKGGIEAVRALARLSEGGGTRTHDLGIKSPLLYQLSYAPLHLESRQTRNIPSH